MARTFYLVTLRRSLVQSMRPLVFKRQEDITNALRDTESDIMYLYSFSDKAEAIAKFEEKKKRIGYEFDHGDMYYFEMVSVKLESYEQMEPGADFENYKQLMYAQPDIPFQS